MEPHALEEVVASFKLLADESRLRILGLLAQRPCSVEELAASLALRTPTVSHHLARLRAAGFVAMQSEGTRHVYHLVPTALRRLQTLVPTPERVQDLAGQEPTQAWEQKVLRDFFEGGRLKGIPASRRKRQVVLRLLVDRFEPGKRYPEREVNRVIAQFHPDFATLRREFVASGLMHRAQGEYWRPGPAN